MKALLSLTFGAMLVASIVFAAGTGDHSHGDETQASTGESHDEHGHKDHSHGHGEDAAMMVGEAGNVSDISRTIKVTMKETAGGDMLFLPKTVSVKRGQTIRFEIKNKGELDHEFVLDEHLALMEHKKVMEKFPEMEHDDPNSVRLEPGEKGEVIWKFTNGGEFEFACLIPGHYDAGMKGALNVVDNGVKIAED